LRHHQRLFVIHEAVFELYKRGGAERTDSAGLAPYIVRSPFAAHRGSITAIPRARRGSGFLVELPVV
jgi:K+-sensing histidine kinase KdpD